MKYAIVALLIILLAPVLSCDTKSSQHPYIIINVNKTGVSSANKLYAVFYFKSDWTTKLFTLSSSSNTIITPFELNVSDYPLYFEIIYDTNGNGTPDEAGNIYQGWSRKTDRTTDTLSPLILPEIPIMILNVDLETAGSFGTF